MSFTPTTLAITPLLETTFISDMRLIVNANTTLLQTQIEDVINELEIDLVNKYIGVDTPVNKVLSNDVVVTNSIVFKAGAEPAASTIASLAQSSDISTFTVHNVTFSKTLQATEVGAKAAAPTVVVGTDGSNISVVNPSTGGVADKGLYVGDATTPIKTRMYGEVEIPKQSVTLSYSNVTGAFTPRTISLIANGTDYTYAKLVLSKTDPQFIFVDLVFPAGYVNWGNSIWLLLHEAAGNRPAAGQTFTIVINKVYKSDMTEVTYSALPQASNLYSADGINVICGANSDTVNYKRAYINSADWTTVPTSDVNAVAAIDTDPKAFLFRFGNIYTQSVTTFKPKGSSFSFTKYNETVDYANYTITNSFNTVTIN